MNATTFAVFTDHCELLIDVFGDKTVYYPDDNTCRTKNTRTLAVFDGFETASGKEGGNDSNILRCYADQDDYDRECEVIDSSTLKVNSILSMQAAPGGKLITRNLFYSKAYPLSARLIERGKKENFEYFYVLYQTSSVFYIKKIIRSLKNQRALWRGDLGENIEISSEMSETVHLAAYKNATELMFIGNYDSNKPMIRLYDTSFSKLSSEKELICKNPENKLIYKKVTTTKTYEDNLYALFNYDDSTLSYSALCVFDLSKLEDKNQMIGDFLQGYSVIDDNDHLRSLAVSNKFITVLSTSGKLFLSKTEDISFSEVDTLPISEPDSNVHMDIAGQHLLLSHDTSFYLSDLNPPKPTLPPVTLKIIQTAKDHEKKFSTDQPYLEKSPETSSTPEALLPFVRNQKSLELENQSIIPKSQEISFANPPAFLVHPFGVIILLLIGIVIFLLFTKRKVAKEKKKDQEVFPKGSTRQTLLSSDSSTPKSSSSSDGSVLLINFNSTPQVPLTSSNEQYASIKRSVSRQRPTSFNTMRPISITGVPEKQESPSYMSQTLPLRGSIRNKNYNAVPAPPVPISQRNRTESITQV